MSGSQAAGRGATRAIDRHFAEFVAGLDDGHDRDAVRLAALLASQRLGEGHVAVDLAAFAGGPAPEPMDGGGFPALEPWRQALLASPAVGDGSGPATPLVLAGSRLYLHRNWVFEQRIADTVAGLAGRPPEVDDALLADGLERLFGPVGEQPDHQRSAAALAVLQRFAIISGGPGTGKTHTVARVLALLLEQASAAGSRPLIRLAAPTGKAAARLSQSIMANLSDAERLTDPAILGAMPREAGTLHRLLGARGEGRAWRHDRHDPLALDVLIVDEASMIDLPLMARLAEALPENARLILLGDRDQLASVEAGAVLGDLSSGADGYSAAFRRRLAAVCGQPLADNPPGGGLADHVALLRRSWRFRDGADQRPGIGALARAVRDGDAARVGDLLAVVDADSAGELGVSPVNADNAVAEAARLATPGYAGLASSADAAEALAGMERLRVLCALRHGPFGAVAINAELEARLAPAGRGRWYHGQPLIILTNDYRLGLFNGDSGIVWTMNGELRAVFPDGSGGLRDLSPHRLPAHDTAYALTVHRSQGSEFERVVLVLPDQPAPILTRELIYTGLTRARARVDVLGEPRLIAEAARDNPTRRDSGLADAVHERLR